MYDTIKSTACLGLVACVALVAGFGAFAAPSAFADSGDAVRFAFAYDAADLDSADGRKALNTRLAVEANKQCRSEHGIHTTLAASKRCHGELMAAVQDALDRRMAGQTGGCVAIALTETGETARACTRSEHAASADLMPRAH